MKLKIILTLGLLGFLTACGGTKQDPLADKPDPVKNSKFEAPKEDSPKPESRDNMVIITDPYYRFSEGQDISITVTAESKYASKYYLEVANAVDFDKAQITTVEGDQATGEVASLTMKWRVPKGLAMSADGQMRLALAVHTKGYTTDGIADDRTVTKDVLLLLSSLSKNAPTVTKVTGLAGAVKENTASSVIKIYVTDPDALDFDGSRPTLVIMPSKNNKGINGASYLSPKAAVKDPATPNGWVFDVAVNLLNMEITEGNGTAYFDVAAFSPRSGNLSSPVQGKFDIWTSVSKPITSWTEDVNFKFNTSNTYTFIVTDPKGEGVVSATLQAEQGGLFGSSNVPCSNLNGAPVCSCTSIAGVNGNANGAVQCSITWTPPNAFGYWEQVFVVTVTNKSSVAGDKDQQQVQFKGKIKFN